jgi:hypothetical protein
MTELFGLLSARIGMYRHVWPHPFSSLRGLFKLEEKVEHGRVSQTTINEYKDSHSGVTRAEGQRQRQQSSSGLYQLKGFEGLRVRYGSSSCCETYHSLVLKHAGQITCSLGGDMSGPVTSPSGLACSSRPSERVADSGKSCD